ncbi:glyoxalase [Flavobacterium akiainvivens]|uniref:Glyoxalase n=1 Tax=Flavobacterium akiainvivens TaxID=1202724 RepID=A0A0M9VJD8_9FLAO|nr:VOC family protein [Flavobacterium akiainvivens]KOS07646.1 glyoxalase [Flavobacterium akiainvivens]SFQ23453.1 PhnB protein [Flavobacterium akiainvivens]
MKVVNPYLNFNGNTEEVFNFYKSVFGGEFAMLMRFKDIPAEATQDQAGEGCADAGVPAGEENGIMHIALPIGSSILMGTDVTSNMPQVDHGNGISLTLSAESREEADRVFNALAEGGKIQMPMQDMFWGDYYGMLTDKFGIQWMMNYSTQW